MQTWIYLFISPDILSHVYQAEIFTGAFVYIQPAVGGCVKIFEISLENILQVSENISDRGPEL